MDRLTRKETGKEDGVEFVLCNYKNNECDDSCQYGTCKWSKKSLLKLKKYEDAEDSGRIQVVDCTGCIHKGNKQFCLNCKRGGCRDYYLVEEK